jgi:uncharacterized protein (DUF1697 family)
MDTYVAMLRSINVGGRNRLTMAALRDLVASLGFGDVATYVQSGNVVFTGSGTPGDVARVIAGGLATHLGVEVPVIVRSQSELQRTVDTNPLVDLEEDPKKLHVTFLADPPDAGRVAAFAGLAGTFGDDQARVVGPDVFLHCPGGYGRTTLNNTFLERKLGATATTRNWRTVCTLADMATPHDTR